MPKTRVLVVDDAVVVRRMVADAIADDPDMVVAGVAANGKIALQMLDQVQPDVVILDVEMPEMDGLQTLAELRKTRPRLPVLMFSTLTKRGAAITIDALSLGASDYIAKPSASGPPEQTLAEVRQNLLQKIRALCPKQSVASPPPKRDTAQLIRTALPHVNVAPDLVAIGVSTGGPTALGEIIPRLPANLPVPVLIVQHMPALFTPLLAERLGLKAKLKVVEAKTGMTADAGVVYIAPGDYHMEVLRVGRVLRLGLHQGPPENSCRPSVDVMFRSVATNVASRTLAVILTGMGQDGLLGCERIREMGGRIFAQDKESSVVWGMPGFVVQAGLADRVLPLSSVADAIVQAVMEHRIVATRAIPAVR